MTKKNFISSQISMIKAFRILIYFAEEVKHQTQVNLTKSRKETTKLAFNLPQLRFSAQSRSMSL